MKQTISQRRVLEFAKSLYHQLQIAHDEGAISFMAASVLWTTMGMTYYQMYRNADVSRVMSKKIVPRSRRLQ